MMGKTYKIQQFMIAFVGGACAVDPIRKQRWSKGTMANGGVELTNILGESTSDASQSLMRTSNVDALGNVEISAANTGISDGDIDNSRGVASHVGNRKISGKVIGDGGIDLSALVEEESLRWGKKEEEDVPPGRGGKRRRRTSEPKQPCEKQSFPKNKCAFKFQVDPDETQNSTGEALCEELSCEPMMITGGSAKAGHTLTFVSQYSPNATTVAFPTMSAGKFIGTLAIAKAVEDEAVDLSFDTRAADVFDWWNKTGEKSDVTLRRLLQFRSGFHSKVGFLKFPCMQVGEIATLGRAIKGILSPQDVGGLEDVERKKLKGLPDDEPFEWSEVKDKKFFGGSRIANVSLEECARQIYREAPFKVHEETSIEDLDHYNLMHQVIAMAMAVKQSNLSPSAFLQTYLYTPGGMTKTKVYPLARPVFSWTVSTMEDLTNLYSKYISGEVLRQATMDEIEKPWTPANGPNIINAMGQQTVVKTMTFYPGQGDLGWIRNGHKIESVSDGGLAMLAGVKPGWAIAFIGDQEYDETTMTFIESAVNSSFAKTVIGAPLSIGFMTGLHYWKGSVFIAIDQVSKTFTIVAPEAGEYPGGAGSTYFSVNETLNDLLTSFDRTIVPQEEVK